MQTYRYNTTCVEGMYNKAAELNWTQFSCTGCSHSHCIQSERTGNSVHFSSEHFIRSCMYAP